MVVSLLDADGAIPPEIMPDALHLSARGYEIWAEAMEDRITALLATENEGASRMSGTDLSI